MSETRTKAHFAVDDNAAALALCGQRDEHLRLLEDAFDVRIFARGADLTVTGDDPSVGSALHVLQDLQGLWREKASVTVREVHRAIALVKEGEPTRLSDLQKDVILMTPVGMPVTPRTLGQKSYVDAIRRHDIVFGIGPAGTGKTYLAMAMAVTALKAKSVTRLILTRPAVEAGEKLGFLPGDLQEKVDPYLRPLYDALYEMLGVEGYQKAVERGVIEVAPLAYMRGRTLDNAFIILDEAQNTTPEQMKMFLTRLGYGSKMVITGDITQVDLPVGKRSGLSEARNVLHDVKGISINMLTQRDVIRHELVKRIIEAYERLTPSTMGTQAQVVEEGSSHGTSGGSVEETALHSQAGATHESTSDVADRSSWPPVQAV